MKKRSFFTGFDLLILGTLVVLLPFGLLMVYDASVVAAAQDFSDPFYYVRNQALWIGIGIGAFLFTSFFDYHYYIPLSRVFLLLSLVLLASVFIPGIGIKTFGAARWLSLGPVSLQPSEIVKLTFILYLARWLCRTNRPFASTQELFSLLVVIGIILSLILFQPDMGTAIIVVGVTLALVFLAEIPMKYLLAVVPIVTLGGIGLIFIAPYRLARLTTFLHPFRDIQATGYHMYQALLAVGSGGMFGIGLGQSRQKYAYLPEATTDSIFAIIAEEVGFVGSSVLVLCFAFLFWRGLRIAQRAPDAFGYYVASGIVMLFGIQALMNFGAMVAVIPLTGAPLPLISYGGSSMIITLTSLGILMNIGRHGVEKRRRYADT